MGFDGIAEELMALNLLTSHRPSSTNPEGEDLRNYQANTLVIQLR